MFFQRRKAVFFCCIFNKSFLLLKTMSSPRSSIKTIAVAQMTATINKEENFLTCKKLIEKAKKKRAQVVFLPEAFDFVAGSKEESVLMSEPLDGPLIKEYQAVARENALWLSLGGFHEKDSSREKNRIYNSHILINSSGDIASIYRKCHLFDVTLPSGQKLKESDYVIPGNKIVPPVDTPVGRIGLSVCYDIRFPEMSLALAHMGADILTYPSAFTVSTGLAHWEVLLRSRAIENQCYVVAAAQTGTHNVKRTSYGHAMIIDPWGCIIAQCHEGVDVVVADIDSEYLKKVRLNMPIKNHRRHDLYGFISVPFKKTNNELQHREKFQEQQFGQVKIHPSQIFYQTSLTMAFVNKKPVLPGHVLVAPLRVVKKLSDLSHEELNDLFQCVQLVQKAIESLYDTSSSTVTIQDGPDAGQSIKHVHVHILPRKRGDFEKNDDIYQKLQTHDKIGASGHWRSTEEMAVEASTLSSHLTSLLYKP